MNNIHILSRGLLIKDDKILLCYDTRMSRRYYFIPGGHVDPSESLEQTLIREFEEEIGMSCVIKKFLGCLEFSFEPKIIKDVCHNHEYIFLFQVIGDIDANKAVISKESNIGFEWIHVDELAIIKLLPQPLKFLIPKWISSENSAALYTKMA